MLFNILISQEIPQEFFQFKFQKLLFDIAENWENNTTLGISRYQDLDKKNRNHDTLYIKSKFGYYRINNSIALYGFGHFQYQKYLYGYLYPRIVNNPSSFIRYSGIEREITRKGFSSGETDLSGIGFQNSWLSFQIGRGREGWGAGDEIKLALNENSPSYDYAMLGSNYGKINVKFIYGYLESNDDNINRYITARGIEWSNKKNFIIGLNETVIYSGQNRPIDFAYLNPMSTHLEIELNDRLNRTGTDGSNAVWQISSDWLFYDKKIRLSVNYLLDEFVLDKVEIDSGKENGKALSSRLAYTPYINKDFILTLYSTYVLVGTPTFRHEVGQNNFVQRNKPLGWVHGSDVYEKKLGLIFLIGAVI